MFPFILFSHLVGDYFLQMPFKDMAIKKRTDTKVCLKHVSIYTLCHLPIVLFFSKYIIISLFLIGLTHFLQDRYWFPFKMYERKLLMLKNSDDINLKIWYPILYVVIDNGYHIFCNTLIIYLL